MPFQFTNKTVIELFNSIGTAQTGAIDGPTHYFDLRDDLVGAFQVFTTAGTGNFAIQGRLNESAATPWFSLSGALTEAANAFAINVGMTPFIRVTVTAATDLEMAAYWME